MQITYNAADIAVKENDPVVLRTTRETFAPVICDFIGWVLSCAQKIGLKRLYFLARDGWIIYNATQIIAEKNKLDIELKYLYCSRLSLRNAALSDLGQEAFKYLLEGGFALTPKVILSRLQLNDDERKSVYKDIGFTDDENTEMGKQASSEFCGRLRRSQVYIDHIHKKSAECKNTAVKYLRQEGLFDDTPYGIVDSGWTGSMQKMLSILTEKKQIGFYFGLYGRPDTNYGEYNPYLFDKDTSPLLVSKFNNHLFEALCSAPHGMTIGYEEKNGAVLPILKEDNGLGPFKLNENILNTQKNELLRYAREEYAYCGDTTDITKRQHFAFPLLNRLIYSPDKRTARIYGSLLFSDDPAELYCFPLAAALEDTKRMYLFPRLYEKYFHKGGLMRPLYWGYGTAVLSGKGRFCRANLRLWEILWLMKR